MGVHGRKVNGAGELAGDSAWDVSGRPVVRGDMLILDGQSQVNDVDLVLLSPDPHHDVHGLDVPVNVRLVVEIFNSSDDLIGEKEDRSEGELSMLGVEDVLEGGTKQVKDQAIGAALGAKHSHRRKAVTPQEGRVDLGLVAEQRPSDVRGLAFDGDFFPGVDVECPKDLCEPAAAEAFLDLVLVVGTEILCDASERKYHEMGERWRLTIWFVILSLGLLQ